MEQERKKLAMQSSSNQNTTEADDDASQWLLLQQKQEELKKLLEREQELKLLREKELAKLQTQQPDASFDPEDPEKSFREWLRQQEFENESMNNPQSNIPIMVSQYGKDSPSKPAEKLPPTPPSILKAKTPGSPKTKRVTIVAVKEPSPQPLQPVKDDKWLEHQAALNM